MATGGPVPLIVRCPNPKCGTQNDLTAAAKAEAKAASLKDLITVRAKCRNCGTQLSHGPFDPFAAGLMQNR